MNKAPVVIACAYLLVAVVTFGHAYNQISDTFLSYDGKVYHNPTESKTVGAMTSSLFWPLYWSAKFWETP